MTIRSPLWRGVLYVLIKYPNFQNLQHPPPPTQWTLPLKDPLFPLPHPALSRLIGLCLCADTLEFPLTGEVILEGHPHAPGQFEVCEALEVIGILFRHLTYIIAVFVSRAPSAPRREWTKSISGDNTAIDTYTSQNSQQRSHAEMSGTAGPTQQGGGQPRQYLDSQIPEFRSGGETNGSRAKGHSQQQRHYFEPHAPQRSSGFESPHRVAHVWIFEVTFGNTADQAQVAETRIASFPTPFLWDGNIPRHTSAVFTSYEVLCTARRQSSVQLWKFHANQSYNETNMFFFIFLFCGDTQHPDTPRNSFVCNSGQNCSWQSNCDAPVLVQVRKHADLLRDLWRYCSPTCNFPTGVRTSL